MRIRYFETKSGEALKTRFKRHALPGATLAQLEEFFSFRLADVQYFVRDSVLNNGIATGDSVFVLREGDSPELSTFILVHEFAHAVQKRDSKRCVRLRVAPTSRHLELEANKAARAFMLGQPCPDLSFDPSGQARCWDEQGHYYTVYLAAVAAGIDSKVAQRIAFYSYMPDMIFELDANRSFRCQCVLDFAQRASIGLAAPATLAINRLKNRTPYTDRTLQIMMTAWLEAVHIGLHCLTGGDSSSQQDYRKRKVKECGLNSPLQLGLALHAFGDSYSHSRLDRPSQMYPTGWGHGVDALNRVKENLPEFIKIDDRTKFPFVYVQMSKLVDAFSAVFEEGHLADNIWKRGPLYLDYAEETFKLLAGKSARPQRVTAEELRVLLEYVSGTPEPGDQTRRLRNAIWALLGNGYEQRDMASKTATKKQLDLIESIWAKNAKQVESFVPYGPLSEPVVFPEFDSYARQNANSGAHAFSGRDLELSFQMGLAWWKGQ